jgi:anti-sigma regulatory factor (Ser/Thr protein kinase)
MSEAQVTLPAAVSSVPTARHFIESILDGWGLRDLAWPATMIVSELASNAALHARGQQFSIRIVSDEAGVRLEVMDSSPRLPQQRTYSSEATTGRGLHLVDELAADWGVALGDEGKTIWAVLRPIGEDDSGEEEVDVDALLDAFSADDDDDNVVPITEAKARACSRWAA